MTRSDTRPKLDEQRLRESLEHANLPSLLMVLFQLTGDRRWLQQPYLPTKSRGLEENNSGGFTDEIQREIKDAAATAILAWSLGTAVAVPAPAGELLGQMACACFADDVPEVYRPMMASQMGFDGPGEQEPTADADKATGTGFSVAVIGAGICGMLAAVRLREAGIPHIVLEKADDVGGVWRQNTYPGAGVDTPSYLYTYQFFPKDWSTQFARQREVLDYLEDFAHTYDVRSSVRFGTEVRDARWDEAEQTWTLSTSNRDGTTSAIVVSAVITAVGLFGQPSIPDIPGMETFEGPVFHSSQWPDGLDITGQRIAVVGTGASAMQIVPATSALASHVEVFQRSPQWIAPVEHYFDPIPHGAHWLFNNVPFYRVWYRARLGWSFNDRIAPALVIDPSWEHPERSVNEQNDKLRTLFTRYLDAKLAGRPDLREKALPHYPPYGKRILLDNGWFDALIRPNVSLVTESVAAITPTGPRTADGREHDADVIVLSTGFRTNHHLHGLDFVGTAGTRLRQVWGDDDATAYLGMCSPGFPNLFYMFGPNTNLGGGSFLNLADSWTGFIIELITTMVDKGYGAVEPRIEAHDDYNQRLDQENARRVWSHPGMTTYARNQHGRITVNMPWRIIDYWHYTAQPDLDHFEFEPVTETRHATDLEHAWPAKTAPNEGARR